MRLRGAGAVALGALLVATGCGEECGVPGEGWLAYVSHSGRGYDLRLVRADGTCDRAARESGAAELSPSISVRGSVLVYWRSAEPSNELVIVELRSGRERVLRYEGLVVEQPEVSPDGEWIVFEGIVPPGRADVYVVPARGGVPVPLAADPADDGWPSWSADGRTVYFSSARSGKNQVWRVGIDGSGLEQVSSDETSALTCGASACAVEGRPTAAPGGRHIAFARATPSQEGAVVVRDLETGEERLLADAPEAEPSWSPDGEFIAVMNTSFGDPEVIVRDARTGVLVSRVTTSPGIDGAPSWAR